MINPNNVPIDFVLSSTENKVTEQVTIPLDSSNSWELLSEACLAQQWNSQVLFKVQW